MMSEPDDRIRLYRNYTSIRRLLRGREFVFTFRYYHQGEDRLSDHIDPMGWAPFPSVDLDMARDGYHMGPVTHRSLGEAFWDRLVESGGRERVLHNLAQRGAAPTHATGVAA
jgi:hypothetical protein